MSSLQVCHCGWSKVTTYHGLRTHQGIKGCTPKGLGIPESARSNQPQISHQNRPSYSTPVKKEPTLMPATHTLPTQMNPAAAEATGSETNKSFFQTPQRSHQTTTNLDKTRRALDFNTDSELLSVSSLQVCHCGWSKVTTYHGLRTHQGIKGCTPKGMGISQNEQYKLTSYLPPFTFMGPSIQLEDIFGRSTNTEINSLSDTRLQVCPKTMNYRDLTTHQGMVKKENGPVFPNPITQMNPAVNQQQSVQMDPNLGTARRALEFNTDSQDDSMSLDSLSLLGNALPAVKPKPEPLILGLQNIFSPTLMPATHTFPTQMDPAAAEATGSETNKSFFQTPQRSHQTTTNLDKTRQALDFNTESELLSMSSLQVCHCGWSKVTTYHGLRTHQGIKGCTPKGLGIPASARSNQPQISHQNRPSYSTPVKKEPTLMPATHTFPTQMNPAAAEATGSETNKSFFQTPQRSHQTTTNLDKTRRALDFSTGVKQVEERIWASPTTIALETDVSSQDKEKEKEQEAHKLQKIRQASLRAELQQKIQIRQRKVNEVNSSVKACKDSLDAEWVEINSVFSEVIKVVEDARQKALQPLEERRWKVKKEAQDLVQSLEGEIGQLKQAIDELDKNPDLQVCPPTGLDESKDWTNLSVDTSFSFGTMRTTVSAMMEQIHQKLDQLSPVELKRIPKFAADVKLDPLTAHHCLVLSVDGKEVRDRGKNQNVPDAPERFDMYGSVLGLNSLTSGKSYWEVEVSNKTGWDLGVTRGDANRKGKLSLNPDNGYWVTVHFKDSEYAALTSPPLSLSLKEKPQKVGVFVDYEEGLVSFYSVTAQSHIYSFTECSFRGEIFPYFSPHLEQNGKNSHPLIISTVGNQ